MTFTLTSRARTLCIGLLALGLVLAGFGFLNDHTDHHQNFWAALFINAFFFFGISLGALFFFALQNATETSWSVLVRRVYEGIFSYLPVGAITVLVVLAAGSVGLHHVWSWMDPAVITEGSDTYDEVVVGKMAYLNAPFFWIRALVYVLTFVLGARWFRKQSLLLDNESGEALVKRHLMVYRRSALFLVLFAVFSSLMAWDWIMSIDVHWFSTLFGWYVFAGMWVGSMICGVVLVMYLKGKGYLPQVNNSHIHDMGKWVFAVSFLWTYLYFSQFMLYWYSNIPEEVIYFKDRIDNHTWLMWGMFFINFLVPMVLLMSRDAKRNPRFLIGVGSVIFVGHWLDLCQMVLPGALGDHFHAIGLLEVGLFLAFLGLFILTVLNALTQAPLTPVNHPYLEESVHHQI